MKPRAAWDLNASDVLEICELDYKSQVNINGHFYWLWCLMMSCANEYG